MNPCIWCNKEMIETCSITQLLSFTKLEPKVSCETCTAKFEKIELDTCCSSCYRRQLDHSICHDCLNWQEVYPEYSLCHRALYTYNEFGKEWMQRFKFTGDIRVAKMVADSLSQVISEYKKIDRIIPVPVSRKSFENRGFNQTEILLKTAKISFVSALENKSTEKNQSTKNREERLDTVQPFSVKKDMQPHISNKSVLIIDDVYTTGRTILYAVESVLNAGAKSVVTFSLFR